MAFGSVFKHRNFRLFYLGQSVSVVGTWMQQVAVGWLVYRLSGSEFLLGLVGFCGQVPVLLLASVTGVYVDRWSRHRTIVVTQVLAMLQAAALAWLTMTDAVAVWHVVLLSAMLGLVNAFDMPARQAFVIELVEGRDNLPNAIALNSSMFNAARLVGPAIAGFLIALVGEGICFLLNAVSFVGVLIALLMMRVPARKPNGPPRHVFVEMAEGFRYAFGFRPIRALLLLLSIVSLAAMPLMVLMPVFATEVLRGGPETLGILTSAIGLGALVGGLLMATRQTVLGLGRQIAWTGLVFGAAVFAFSLSDNLAASLPLLAIGGFAMMMETTATNTILQTIVDEDKRGRVMSLQTMAFLGMAPIGSLLAGSLASHLGAVNTIRIAAIACLIGSLHYARQLPKLREAIRPIYQQMGILPTPASGSPEAPDAPLDAS